MIQVETELLETIRDGQPIGGDDDPNLLIVGGVGSGKTNVLVQRAVRALLDGRRVIYIDGRLASPSEVQLLDDYFVARPRTVEGVFNALDEVMGELVWWARNTIPHDYPSSGADITILVDLLDHLATPEGPGGGAAALERNRIRGLIIEYLERLAEVGQLHGVNVIIAANRFDRGLLEGIQSHVSGQIYLSRGRWIPEAARMVLGEDEPVNDGLV